MQLNVYQTNACLLKLYVWILGHQAHDTIITQLIIVQSLKYTTVCKWHASVVVAVTTLVFNP